MSAPDRPDPTEYFTARFPAQWERTLGDQERAVEREQRLFDDMRAVDATLRIRVAGEDGGCFDLNVRAGLMTAGGENVAAPFMTLLLERDDFTRLAEEAGDSPLSFLGALSGQGGDLKITESRMANLRLLDGTLRFELTGDGGFSIVAHFGPSPPADEPTTTLRVDRAAYEDLKSGKVAAQDAFLSGQIALEGDMQLAMQLALAVLSPD